MNAFFFPFVSHPWVIVQCRLILVLWRVLGRCVQETITGWIDTRLAGLATNFPRGGLAVSTVRKCVLHQLSTNAVIVKADYLIFVFDKCIFLIFDFWIFFQKILEPRKKQIFVFVFIYNVIFYHYIFAGDFCHFWKFFRQAVWVLRQLSTLDV